MKLIGEQSKLCVKEMLQLGNNIVNIECEEWCGNGCESSSKSWE